jgi:molecular chaperone GrpE (heat shock protein)
MAPLRSYFASFLGSFRSAPKEDDPVPAGLPPVDVGEEFQKVQRSLRRLSMASDRSGELLQNVSTRLDEMQQRLLQMSRGARAGVSFEEDAVLRVLDQLERAASMIEASAAALEPVAAARDALLSASGWQRVALIGTRPEGTAIRIAEVTAGAPRSGGDVHIARIIEQGYRRADGSLLRPAVVIATPAGS